MAKYSTSQKIVSVSLAVLGISSIIFTSTGITGNIIRNSNIDADPPLLGFSLGILLLAVSAMIIVRKIK